MTTLGNSKDKVQIVKAYKEVSRHYDDQVCVSVRAWGLFSRGRKPHLLSDMWGAGDTVLIMPLYGHLRSYPRVTADQYKAWLRSLPINNCRAIPVTAEVLAQVESRAQAVDSVIAIFPIAR